MKHPAISIGPSPPPSLTHVSLERPADTASISRKHAAKVGTHGRQRRSRVHNSGPPGGIAHEVHALNVSVSTQPAERDGRSAD
jgi:hypothetical protein